MAVLAYILINSIATKSASVVKEALNIDGVKAAHRVTGRYDVIAVVEKDNLDEILGKALDEIQAIEGVVGTMTCLAIE